MENISFLKPLLGVLTIVYFPFHKSITALFRLVRRFCGKADRNLSVLALEFAPAQNHPKDFDIMSRYWSRWFLEMGLTEQRFKIVKTDMPALTKNVIQRYLSGLMR